MALEVLLVIALVEVIWLFCELFGRHVGLYMKDFHLFFIVELLLALEV